AMAVADFFGAALKDVNGAIKPLRGGNASKFTFALADHGDRLRETIDLFIDAILDGRFPAFPDESDDLGSCQYCPVNHSCRTKHDDGENFAVTRHGDPRTLLEKS